jgi:hypothetical protein
MSAEQNKVQATVATLTPAEAQQLERLDHQRVNVQKHLRELSAAIPPLPPGVGEGGVATSMRILLELRLLRGHLTSDADVLCAALDGLTQLTTRETATAALNAAVADVTQPHSDWVRLRVKAGMPAERWSY